MTPIKMCDSGRDFNEKKIDLVRNFISRLGKWRNEAYCSQIRCGIIPYTVIDGRVYMCFGEDRRSGDLTDFSGGRKRSEDPIECAVREYNEETCLALGRLRPEEVSNSLCVYDRKSICILLRVDIDCEGMRIVGERFSSKCMIPAGSRKDPSYNEVSRLIWLDEVDISSIFITNKNRFFSVYDPIYKLLSRCHRLTSSLITLRLALMGCSERSRGLLDAL